MEHFLKKGKREMPTDLAASFRSPFANRETLAKKVEDDKKKDEPENAVSDEAEDENEGEDGKKTKKRRAEDKEDEDDEKKPDARAARARERARIDTIMSCAEAKQLPGAALSLALNSSMPRHQAVKMLASMAADLSSGANRRAALSERMASIPQPNVGLDGPNAPVPGSTAELAAAIVNAGRRRRGEI
ncbi:MAG TPA: hypothetical protein VN742_00395 [Candidatus Binataceae bacterium]|nr:hypothetical protein [Candidatus Binataceae bacterium]